MGVWGKGGTLCQGGDSGPRNRLFGPKTPFSKGKSLFSGGGGQTPFSKGKMTKKTRIFVVFRVFRRFSGSGARFRRFSGSGARISCFLASEGLISCFLGSGARFRRFSSNFVFFGLRGPNFVFFGPRGGLGGVRGPRFLPELFNGFAYPQHGFCP